MMDREKLIFVDTETTGLDPDVHEIWEVTWAIWEPTVGKWISDTRQLPVDVGKSDPMALKINGFYDRSNRDDMNGSPKDMELWRGRFAYDFVKVSAGRHIVGMVPSFDEERLRSLVRASGECPMWHYHVIDLEAMAIGALIGRSMEIPKLPWRSDDLSKMLGVDPDHFDRHSSAGDVAWSIALFEEIVRL